ncbi:unnamed protein product [Caenorhabditis sp. 36 PRJEB53466]|nr:unnamed protein product [Caenorhabditis sp. 36 PRJEB53466]
MDENDDYDEGIYFKVPEVTQDGSLTMETTFDTDPEDDDEPPLEPRFKYERLKGEESMTFMKTASFTAIDLHDKFLAIGTSKGFIYILDHHGYGDFDNVPVMKPHRCSVTNLKFDETGSYVLSCANDGKIVVSGVGNDRLCCTVNIQGMPKSVAFSPDFNRQQSGHCFVVGERSLVIYEKRLFQYKATSLWAGSERDGFINCCSWSENFIAFTNDTGTRIYERGTEKIITSVQPSHDVDRVRSSRSPPKHLWMADSNLIIGWADTVTFLRIRDTDGVRRGEIHHIFHVSMFVCGMSYIPNTGVENVELFLIGLQLEGEDFDDCASVISSVTTLTATENSACSVLKTCVIRPLGLKEYELQSEDVIENVALAKHTLPSMINGLGIPYLNTYFILTNRYVIMALPYGPEDGIKWRLKYKLYDEAFEMAKQHAELLAKTEYNKTNVGRLIIEGYLTGKRAKAAAFRLPAICGENKEEWEWAVQRFADARLCTLLADVLPEKPQLEAETYETVLMACLFNNPRQFRKLVQTWSPDLYQTSYIIDKAQWRIQQISKSGDEKTAIDETERILMDSLAHLYLYERKYENALKILMSCHDFQIFNVIDKHQLFDLVKNNITELMAINSERALRLLLDNADSVEPAFVMEKIGRQPKLQLAYLTKLMSRNEGVEFADRAVQLYAEYEPKKLLPFLRKNVNYNVNKARKLCEDKCFVEETIYLLAKSGNHYEAVKMMVREYKNMEKVIAYCKDQNDADLWIHLLEVVTEYPSHFAQLIIEASNCLDPVLIMEKLPDDTEIPNLSEALDKLLTDYTNHAESQESCYKSTLTDVTQLTQNVIDLAESSVFIDLYTICPMCYETIQPSQEHRRMAGCKTYKCGHTFHLTCIAESDRKKLLEEGECYACSDQLDRFDV